MSCPVHTTKAAGDSPDPNDRRPVEEEGIVQRFIGEFIDIVSEFFGSLVEALREGEIDPEAGFLALDLRERFDSQRPAFVTTFKQGWQDGFDTGREAAIRQEELDISFDVTHDETEAQIRRNAERAAEQVELTIVGNLVDVLVEGHRRGLGITEDEATGEPGIADLLQQQVFEDITSWKAEQVARTEVISASNFGAYSSYQDSNATEKQWLATDDERTRESHMIVDNQVKPMDEPFVTGAGNEAMYPGSPSLPPSDRINCRCSLIPTDFDF